MKKTNVIKLDQSICAADADDNAVLFVRSAIVSQNTALRAEIKNTVAF